VHNSAQHWSVCNQYSVNHRLDLANKPNVLYAVPKNDCISRNTQTH